jgi:hypothetical protein
MQEWLTQKDLAEKAYIQIALSALMYCPLLLTGIPVRDEYSRRPLMSQTTFALDRSINSSCEASVFPNTTLSGNRREYLAMLRTSSGLISGSSP